MKGLGENPKEVTVLPHSQTLIGPDDSHGSSTLFDKSFHTFSFLVGSSEGWRVGSGQVRVARGSALLLSSHGRGICSVFPSREPGLSGDFWGSQEGCQGAFRPEPLLPS